MFLRMLEAEAGILIKDTTSYTEEDDKSGKFLNIYLLIFTIQCLQCGVFTLIIVVLLEMAVVWVTPRQRPLL